MGGPGAFLAMGSLALPLGLAIVLHVLSPRGSRESLSYRLEPYGAGEPGRPARGHARRERVPGRNDGRSLVLPAVRRGAGGGRASPARRARAGCRSALTCLLLASLGLGARCSPSPGRWSSAARRRSHRLLGIRPAPLDREPADPRATSRWSGRVSAASARFIPTSRRRTQSSTTAMSSLLQCGVESGAVGLGLLGLAGAVVRLPPAGLPEARRLGRPNARLRLDRSGPGL